MSCSPAETLCLFTTEQIELSGCLSDSPRGYMPLHASVPCPGRCMVPMGVGGPRLWCEVHSNGCHPLGIRTCGG